MSLVNQGTILAETSGQTVTVSGRGAESSATNQGTLQATGGTLDINTLTGDLGNASVSGSGHLDVNGSFTNSQNHTLDGESLTFGGDWSNTAIITASNGSTLSMQGNWDNSGTIGVTDSTVNLGGSTSGIGAISVSGSDLNIVGRFTTAQFESILLNNNQVTLGLVGVLDNSADVLDVNAITGNLILNGGKILGGTVLSADGAKLIALANNSNQLERVTLEADLDLSTTNATVRIVNELTLNGTIRMTTQSSLAFEGTQSAI